MPYAGRGVGVDPVDHLRPTVNDKTWDALRLFRDRYRDQAPEKVP